MNVDHLESSKPLKWQMSGEFRAEERPEVTWVLDDHSGGRAENKQVWQGQKQTRQEAAVEIQMKDDGSLNQGSEKSLVPVIFCR